MLTREELANGLDLTEARVQVRNCLYLTEARVQVRNCLYLTEARVQVRNCLDQVDGYSREASQIWFDDVAGQNKFATSPQEYASV